MVERHQRRTLPAEAHIGMAETVHHRHAQEFREAWPIAQLPGEALLRPVPNGLAVKADEIRAGDAEIALKLAYGLPEGIGDCVFEFRQRIGFGDLRVLQHFEQLRFQVGRIGVGSPGHALDIVLAIRKQEGKVDRIHRGAADRTDRHERFLHRVLRDCREQRFRLSGMQR